MVTTSLLCKAGQCCATDCKWGCDPACVFVCLLHSNVRHSCVRQFVSGALAKIHHWLHGHSGSVGPPDQWKIGNSDADDGFVGFHLLFSGIILIITPLILGLKNEKVFNDNDCGYSGPMQTTDLLFK